MIRRDITDQWETLRSDPEARHRFILAVYGAERIEAACFPNAALYSASGALLGLIDTHGYPRITHEGERIYLELSDLVLAIGLPDGNAYREPLAALAHTQWSGWMKYMFDKSRRNPGGSITIPAALVARWTRQMQTPYADLPDEERASDRREAEKVLGLLLGLLDGEGSQNDA